MTVVMTTSHHVDVVDLDILSRARDGELRVTIMLATERAGRETMAGATKLKNLLRDARGELAEQGYTDSHINSLLADAEELVEDDLFWQRQADGLLILITEAETVFFRVPVTLPEQVSVATTWRLEPLVHLLAPHQSVHLLAISPNSVRLFQTDGVRIGQLELGPIPESSDSIFQDRDHQPQLQHAPQGGGDASFHGHGGGSEANNVATDRFLRHVARGLEERIPVARRRPLLLAGVAELTHRFRGMVDWNEVLEGTITGRPDHLSEGELAEAAAETLQAWRTESDKDLVERIHREDSKGLIIRDLSEIADAAQHGRVAVLLARTDQPTGALVMPTALDAAIADVLASGGEVEELPAEIEENYLAIARY